MLQPRWKMLLLRWNTLVPLLTTLMEVPLTLEGLSLATHPSLFTSVKLMLSQDTDTAQSTPMVTMSTKAIPDMLAHTSTVSNTEVITSISVKLKLMLSQDTDTAQSTPMATMSTKAIPDMLAHTNTVSNMEVITSISARLRQENTTATSQLLITQKEPLPMSHQPHTDIHHMDIAMVTRESTTTEIILESEP